MKILQINNQHFLKGGAHKVYLETGNLLKSYGHEVFYFSQKNGNNIANEFSEFWPEEVDYRKLSLAEKITSIKKFVFNEDAFLKLSKFIDYVKPDIAHIHLFMGGLSSSILKALKEKNIPIVHSVHDFRLICPAYTFLDRNNKICERCIDKKYLRCATKRCALDRKTLSSVMLAIDAYYRRYFTDPLVLIDKFIFVSNFSKNKHIEFDNRFINKSNVLYNFSKLNYTFEKKGEKYFLYFGRISREKGLENIINVFNELDSDLYIIGDGPKELKSVINNLFLFDVNYVESLVNEIIKVVNLIESKKIEILCDENYNNLIYNFSIEKMSAEYLEVYKLL